MRLLFCYFKIFINDLYLTLILIMVIILHDPWCLSDLPCDVVNSLFSIAGNFLSLHYLVLVLLVIWILRV